MHLPERMQIHRSIPIVGLRNAANMRCGIDGPCRMHIFLNYSGGSLLCYAFYVRASTNDDSGYGSPSLVE